MFEPGASLIRSMVRSSIVAARVEALVALTSVAISVAACRRDDARPAETPEAPAVAAPQAKAPPRPAKLAHVTI